MAARGVTNTNASQTQLLVSWGGDRGTEPCWVAGNVCGGRTASCRNGLPSTPQLACALPGVRNYWQRLRPLLFTRQVRTPRTSWVTDLPKYTEVRRSIAEPRTQSLRPKCQWGRDSSVSQYRQTHNPRVCDWRAIVLQTCEDSSGTPDMGFLLPPILPFPVLSSHICHRWLWSGGR